MSSLSEASCYRDPAADELLQRSPMPRRVLFLDRDGVINVDHGYVHTPRQTDWVPGIFDVCRAARAVGYLLVVVTNQAGIARGLYSEEAFLDYTRWVHREFARMGANLLATYYCPHHPKAHAGDAGVQCNCRKPAPGMILRAARDVGCDVAVSVLLGDKSSDIDAGLEAGVAMNILYGAVQKASIRNERIRQVQTMAQATQMVVGRVNNPGEGPLHAFR